MRSRLNYIYGCGVAAAGILFLCAPVFAAPLAPVKDSGPFIPNENEFAAALVMVPQTHQVLYGFKPHLARSAASLTKLANALAFVKTKPQWNKIVSIKKKDEVGGGRLRVKSGATLSITDMLFSSITASANNAATALARVSGYGLGAFLRLMNKEAKAAGASDSQFVDPAGMDPKNQTTAYDIARIAEKAFKTAPIGKAASTEAYSFTIRNTGEQKTIKNTNQLLTNDPEVYVIGGKTGYLEESKNNLVVQMRPMNSDGTGDPKKELIIVVMGSSDKASMFFSAKRLADWAWQNYEF